MKPLSYAIALSMVLSGCTTLVNDPVKQTNTAAAKCSGSDWHDDSSMAVLPVPLVAFFVPHADLNEIRADEYLRRCGEPSTLTNRNVEVSRVSCVPAALTRIITLGIWQWCPAKVTWEADVAPRS